MGWDGARPPRTRSREDPPRSGTLDEAAAADRQFVRFHPELFLAGKPAIATPVHVHAGSLQYRGDAHLLALELGVEGVDQDLVLVELDLAQASGPSWPDLGRQLQLRPRSLCWAWLDGDPGRGRPRKPDPGPGRRRRRPDRQRFGDRQRWRLSAPGGGLLRRPLGSPLTRLRRCPLGRFGGRTGRRPGARRLASSPSRLLGRPSRRTHPRIF